MTDFVFDSLLKPISDEAPCGPNLYDEFDPDYMNFEARIEGVLPAYFASFDRGAVDFPAEFALISKICAKSVDARVLVPFAKMLILNRDFTGFVDCVGAVAAVLDQRWDVLNPPYDGGGEECARTTAVRALDDAPHTCFPLQSAPLFKTRRFGAVTYRAHLLVEGAIKPRKGAEDGDEDEKPPSSSDLRGAIADVELTELVAARDAAGRLVAAISAIETTYDDKSGKPGGMRLKQLREMAVGVHVFLDSCVVSRDPALGALTPANDEDDGGRETAGDAGAAGTGSLRSGEEAVAALRAASAYFARKEPSSPARLWLAQANALVGKSFFDALRALVPDHASTSSVVLMRGLPLTLPLERLQDILADEPAPEDDWEEPAPEPEREEATAEDVGDGEDGEPRAEPEPAPEAPPPAAARRFAAKNRAAALRLLEEAANYYRVAEPSSPLPLLLDQARGGVGRDFLSLLREVLPPRALQADE